MDVDFSAIKNFHITEAQTLQFRTELLNMFNHPQFRDSQAPTPMFLAVGPSPARLLITSARFNSPCATPLVGVA